MGTHDLSENTAAERRAHARVHVVHAHGDTRRRAAARYIAGTTGVKQLLRGEFGRFRKTVSRADGSYRAAIENWNNDNGGGKLHKNVQLLSRTV